MCGETRTGGRGLGKGHSLDPTSAWVVAVLSVSWMDTWIPALSSGTQEVWSLTSTLPSGAGEQSTGPCYKTEKGAAVWGALRKQVGVGVGDMRGAERFEHVAAFELDTVR